MSAITLDDLYAWRRALESAEIVDMAEYAEDWKRLAAWFYAFDCPSAADACWRRWQHYRDQAEQAVSVSAETEVLS